MNKIDRFLGIDRDDPMQVLADRQLTNDTYMLDRLVRARNDAGLTQQQVAESMGVSQSVVARLEARVQDPHMSTVRRYALAVGAEIRHQVTPNAIQDVPSRPVARRDDPVAVLTTHEYRGRRVESAVPEPRHYRRSSYASASAAVKVGG